MDANGNSPTPNELFAILNHIETYVKGTDHDQPREIDSFKGPGISLAKSQGGYRKYLYISKLSPAHVKQLNRFVQNVRKRITDISPNKHHEPLTHPLCGVGYGVRSEDRLKSHKKHMSSNYVMDITEAVVGVLFKQNVLSKLYEIKQFIIFICFDPAHGALSEIVLARLDEGYHGNGRGFSHYPLGEAMRLQKASSMRSGSGA